MGPLTCRLPPSTCRTAATRALAQATRPRTAAPAAPSAAAAAAAPPSSRTLTTSPSSRTPAAAAAAAAARRSRQSQLRPRLPAPSAPAGPRPYHSYDHPSPPDTFSPAERAILAAAHARVPEHGFTQKALALGARDAGYLDISTNVLPDGVFSLVLWHIVYQREALALKSKVLFSGEEGARLGLGAKVEMLTWERLMGNEAVVGRLQEALAIMAQPSHVPASLRELARLSDEIWFLVGDTAVDPSWYTKRASLSATYASAELFMTTDHSEGFAETRRFLRRRLEEVQGVGGTLRSVGQWVGYTANASLNVLRSKGVRI